MKIIYLSGSDFPSFAANSIHVFKMAQAFVNAGNEVLLTGRYDNKDSAPVNETEVGNFYGVEPQFRSAFFTSTQKRFQDPLHALKSYKAGKKFGAELYFGRHVMSCMLSAFMGKKTVVELHTIPGFTGIKKVLFEKFLQNKNLKSIVVITGSLKQELTEKYSLPLDFVQVAHDAADDPKPFATPAGFDNGKVNIAYIGHLYPGKGMELIAQLIPLVPSNVHFQILGGTAAEIEKWKEKLAGFSNYTFHGLIPPIETVNYRYAADILIAPYSKEVKSKGGTNINRWMSPLKLFEYMAAAKPILISDLAVIQEVLVHEEDGLLVDPDNLEQWVAEIKRLITDAEFGKQLGAKARAKFEENYTWNQRAINILHDIPS